MIERGERHRWFWPSLGAIAIVGLAVRLAYVMQWKWDKGLWGDAWFYQQGGRFLSEGHGFISVWPWLFDHQALPSADHPPLFTIFLAALNLLGITSTHAQLITMCLVGALGIVMIALAARRVGGDRVGLIAAAVAALYPAIWINDGMLLSETIYVVLIAGFVLWCYRYRDTPTMRNAVVLALFIALAVITRFESIFLLPLVVVPLVLSAAKRRSDVRPIATLAVFGVVTLALLGPWVGYNLSRFSRPMPLAHDGTTFAAANCKYTYSGEYLGYWDQRCIGGDSIGGPGTPVGEPKVTESSDNSVLNAFWRTRALDYMRAHAEELPKVILARVGRLWGVYRPGQTAYLDGLVEGRELGPARWAVGFYYALVPCAVVGVVALRRRRTTVIPLVVPFAIATFVAATSMGVLRYRVGADVALVILGAIGIDGFLRWWSARRTARRGRSSPLRTHRVEATVDVDDLAGRRREPVRE